MSKSRFAAIRCRVLSRQRGSAYLAIQFLTVEAPSDTTAGTANRQRDRSGRHVPTSQTPEPVSTHPVRLFFEPLNESCTAVEHTLPDETRETK